MRVYPNGSAIAARQAHAAGRGRAIAGVPQVLFRLRELGRVVDGIEFLELYVVEIAVNPFDPPDIDILDDVTSIGIDRDRPATERRGGSGRMTGRR